MHQYHFHENLLDVFVLGLIKHLKLIFHTLQNKYVYTPYPTFRLIDGHVGAMSDLYLTILIINIFHSSDFNIFKTLNYIYMIYTYGRSHSNFR